jgi:hyperosmotically inducible protein
VSNKQLKSGRGDDTKVKAKLFDDSMVKGLAISVETFEGEVTLTGAVDTQTERQRAEYLAGTVIGVRGVNNLLKVKM